MLRVREAQIRLTRLCYTRSLNMGNYDGGPPILTFHKFVSPHSLSHFISRTVARGPIHRAAISSKLYAVCPLRHFLQAGDCLPYLDASTVTARTGISRLDLDDKDIFKRLYWERILWYSKHLDGMALVRTTSHSPRCQTPNEGQVSNNVTTDLGGPAYNHYLSQASFTLDLGAQSTHRILLHEEHGLLRFSSPGATRMLVSFSSTSPPPNRSAPACSGMHKLT